jgi:hypothetical protein
MLQVLLCNLFFSSPVDTEHYSILVFLNNTNIQIKFILPKEINAKTKIKHNIHNLIERRNLMKIV